jgi:pimeloyl-ACP methyl ester carboxylesterase
MADGGDFQELELDAPDGAVACRLWDCAGATRAVVWVGGVGGGWDTPANGLYPRLAEGLRTEAVVSLRVRFRDPTRLAPATADVRTAIAWLAARGMVAVGLVGHSFGGAVVVRAALDEPLVRAVVGLAPQSRGAEDVALLAPRCALLLIHGRADAVLPPACAITLARAAGEPKRLLLYDGAGHRLDEVTDAVAAEVRAWLVGWLAAGADITGPAPGIPKGDEDWR